MAKEEEDHADEAASAPPPYEHASSSVTTPRARIPTGRRGKDFVNDGIAPPSYEPWSYAQEYTRIRAAARARGENVGDGRSPAWHGPPVYHIQTHHDTKSSYMTVHIAPPQSFADEVFQTGASSPIRRRNHGTSKEEKGRAVHENGKSSNEAESSQLRHAQLRRPAVWRAETWTSQDTRRAQSRSEKGMELRRISPYSEVSELAITAQRDRSKSGATSFVGNATLQGTSKGGMLLSRLTKAARGSSSKDVAGSRHEVVLQSSRNKKLANMAWCEPESPALCELLLPDSRRFAWTQSSDGQRLELLDPGGIPMAIVHLAAIPVRLELTGFPWARMPSDELECDYPGCSLRPLFGFNFRCRDCSDAGDDTFDICEAHLPDLCARPTIHAQHRFVRQPRPWTPFDDHVRETPLLRMRDLECEREAQEVVLASLACVLPLCVGREAVSHAVRA